MRLAIPAALLLILVATPAAALRDRTAAALDACLAVPANASTAAQVDCEAAALRRYDARMNAAYANLMRKLPRPAADRLRAAQRAWLAFRDSEAPARRALYETRQGTMYVPMAADDAVRLVRDRALQLEAYVRVMAIG